jgi:hypothetical protein
MAAGLLPSASAENPVVRILPRRRLQQQQQQQQQQRRARPAGGKRPVWKRKPIPLKPMDAYIQGAPRAEL